MVEHLLCKQGVSGSNPLTSTNEAGATSATPEIDAKPELLIHADEVACAHGNTIGALDEQALFYMRQRGLPEIEARALLIEAFVGEVIDRINYEPAREIARAWAEQRLRV